VVGLYSETKGSARLITLKIVDDNIGRATNNVKVQKWLLTDDGVSGLPGHAIENLVSNGCLELSNNAV